MHIYHAAYRKNLRRALRIIYFLFLCAVLAICMRRYNDLIPLAAVPLTVFAIVHGIILSGLVKARRRFEARGDIAANEGEFDSEFRSGDMLCFDHLYFTAHWLFCDNPTDTFLVPVGEVAWMYKTTENNTTPRLAIHFKHDDKVELNMEDGQVDAILFCATARYPHIVVGYSKELAATYDTDRGAFQKKLAKAPRVLVDASSPFADPYYQTIVYVKLEGKKRKCLMALTRDGRLILICGDTVIFERAAAGIDSTCSLWFGRLTLRFEHPNCDSYTVKTYNVRRWRSLLRKAKSGANLGGYEKLGYSNVDSYNFAASQNGYYLQFVAAFFSLWFFGLIQFAYWVKEESLWDEGIGMGIATFFLLPLLLPPILVYGFFYLKDLQGARLFPQREDGE